MTTNCYSCGAVPVCPRCNPEIPALRSRLAEAERELETARISNEIRYERLYRLFEDECGDAKCDSLLGKVTRLIDRWKAAEAALAEARAKALPEDARERIARAVFNYPGEWEKLSERGRGPYFEVADAVLAALKEPR